MVSQRRRIFTARGTCASLAAAAVVRVGGSGAPPAGLPAGDPPECAAYADLFASHIWSDLAPLAARHGPAGGPIHAANVSELREAVRGRSGWEYYFVEIAVVDGRVLFHKGPKDLGPWQRHTLTLIALSVERFKEWIPNVYFVLSVLDEPFLERARSRPLPLFASMTTRAHWDIPVPTYAFFESEGGVSSARVKQDYGDWENEEWQARLRAEHPWDTRKARGFFRGHDWDSSNGFIEFLSTRGADSCIPKDDVSMAFGYRRWYADQCRPGGPLEGVLDVGLTGAPSFREAADAEREYAAPVSLPDHARHKYLLHLDGTTASNRLAKLLLMGSVVLKQDTVYEEYFNRFLEPHVHFVPFSRDRCSTQNLTAALAWLREHDDEARAIAERGQRFASEWLSRKAATCYWQRLLASYGALQAFDPRFEARLSEFSEWAPPKL